MKSKFMSPRNKRKPMKHLNEDAFRVGLSDFRKGVMDPPAVARENFEREWQRGWNYGYFKAYRKCRSVERSIAERNNAA